MGFRPIKQGRLVMRRLPARSVRAGQRHAATRRGPTPHAGTPAAAAAPVAAGDDGYDAFWAWAARAGAESVPLFIGTRHAAPEAGGRPALRGLFAATAARAGDVLATVPFQSACLSPGAAPFGLLPPRAVLPSPAGLRRRGVGGGEAEAQHLWLAAAVACLVAARGAGPSPTPGLGLAVSAEVEAGWGPYLDLLPAAVPPSADVATRQRDAAAAALLTPPEQAQLAALAAAGRAEMDKLGRLLRRRAAKTRYNGVLPSPAALEWAQRVVWSRALLLPAGCAPTMPRSIEEWAAELEETDAAADDPSTADGGGGGGGAPMLPAMIPIMDMVNAPPPGGAGNCELATAEAVGVPHGAAARVVLRATAAVAAGDELVAPYAVADRPAAVLRFGFC